MLKDTLNEVAAEITELAYRRAVTERMVTAAGVPHRTNDCISRLAERDATCGVAADASLGLYFEAIICLKQFDRSFMP